MEAIFIELSGILEPPSIQFIVCSFIDIVYKVDES
jgi:hypothetical protein